MLNGVGARSTRDYLLESLVDPSARIAPGFETVIVTLQDGDVVDGQKLSENLGQISLRLSDGEVRPIPRTHIKSTVTSTISSMPPMLDLLSPFEIRDLVAYLAELK